ncbi:MAG: 50S ribosomal protein L24 [Bacteroidota bacterium]
MATKNIKLHIRKGDTVRVLSGRDRGKEGEVLVVMPREGKAIVEGINMVSKHMRPNQQNTNGGIVQQEAPIYVSKLMLIDPKTKEPTRVGRIKNETGKGWVRVSKKTGEAI